jgi:hypothetical protein
MSRVLSRDKGNSNEAGSSQASAFTCTTISGGKNPGPTGTGSFLQPGQPLLKEALAPQADHLAARTEAVGDLIISQAVRGQQDHSRAQHQKIR